MRSLKIQHMGTHLTNSPFKVWDYIIFAGIAIVCYFSFQQWDIIHTGGSSFAYLTGHWLDFYEYNAPIVTVNNYLPTTYLIFAVWNLPLKLFGIVADVTLNIDLFVLMWYKLLPTLFFFGSSFIMYKICMQFGMGQVKSKLAMYLMLTTPTAFFSQFIFGQYDSITMFFVLCGILSWCKNKWTSFAIFFGIAITCKYFALLLFIPLLMLREKNLLKLLKSIVIASIPFIAEVLIYLPSPAFRSGVFGFGATGYLFKMAMGNSFASVSLVLVGWVMLCATAYFVVPQHRDDELKYLTFGGLALIFLVFGLSFWHPQWLMFATPFFVFGLLLHNRFDIFVLLDLALMLFFTVITVNIWINHVDQQLLSAGIWQTAVAGRMTLGLTMSQLFVIKDINMLFSGFVAILLVMTVFRHPKFLAKDMSQLPAHYVGWARTRLIVGVSIFVIPAFICLASILLAPVSILESGPAVAHIGPTVASRQVEEHFTLSADCNVTQIHFNAGTYARENDGNLSFSIYQKDSNNLVLSQNIPLWEINDNIDTEIVVEPTVLYAGTPYYIQVQVQPATVDDVITLYHSAEGTATEDNYAMVDGVQENYNLSIRLLGEKERGGT